MQGSGQLCRKGTWLNNQSLFGNISTQPPPSSNPLLHPSPVGEDLRSLGAAEIWNRDQIEARQIATLLTEFAYIKKSFSTHHRGSFSQRRWCVFKAKYRRDTRLMIPPNHNGRIYSCHQTEWQISSRFLEASDVALKLSTAAWNVFFLIFAACGLWKLCENYFHGWRLLPQSFLCLLCF